jgi:hypothetical protein
MSFTVALTVITPLNFGQHYAHAHRRDEVQMRRELREAINGRARHLMREGICETWPEAKMKADALTRCKA